MRLCAGLAPAAPAVRTMAETVNRIKSSARRCFIVWPLENELHTVCETNVHAGTPKPGAGRSLFAAGPCRARTGQAWSAGQTFPGLRVWHLRMECVTIAGS